MGEVVDKVEEFVHILGSSTAMIHQHEDLQGAYNAAGVTALDSIGKLTQDKHIVQKETCILVDHVSMGDRVCKGIRCRLGGIRGGACCKCVHLFSNDCMMCIMQSGDGDWGGIGLENLANMATELVKNHLLSILLQHLGA